MSELSIIIDGSALTASARGSAAAAADEEVKEEPEEEEEEFGGCGGVWSGSAAAAPVSVVCRSYYRAGHSVWLSEGGSFESPYSCTTFCFILDSC